MKLDGLEAWAVWTTPKDGVCTPGWWRWDGQRLYNYDSQMEYVGSYDLVAVGYCIPDWDDYPVTVPPDWPYMVEALVFQGDLP